MILNTTWIRAQKSDPPNIVLIVIDDLGARDLGSHGSDLHETPNLDTMATNGIEFTRAYSASPVCSPTRASIQTGKNPARLHMTTWHESSMEGPKKNKPMIPSVSEPNLSPEETTLAEIFKAAGYHTYHVGKWHLGGPKAYPQAHGFDINIGGTSWGAPQSFFYPFSNGYREYFNGWRYVPDLEPGQQGDYLTDRLTDRAIEIMEGQKDEPFFLNLCYHTVHTPIEGKPQIVEKYRRKIAKEKPANHINPHMAAMMESMDDNVGRVLSKIDELGLRERTIVVLTSDNGGFIGRCKLNPDLQVTSNAPLRSGKGSLYEGGIRIPLFMQIPGIKEKKIETPVTTTDIFPTLLDLADLGYPKGDGMTLRPLFKDKSFYDNNPRPLIFHFPHYYGSTTPVSAIIHNNIKLIQHYTPQGLEYELFDLLQDPSETRNLAIERNIDVKSLSAELNSSLWEMGANFPSKNPDFMKIRE